MLSTAGQFPKDDFLNSLRSSGKFQSFLKEINRLNIQWIYETLKFIHNVLIDGKQAPNAKLNSLKYLKCLVETCQVPCLTLIQVYLLPILIRISSYKPQQKGQRRGNRFFIENGYSQRIAEIEETGIKFLALSTEILYVCSLIKTKRVLENEQLIQRSQFVAEYNRIVKMGITEIHSINQLKFFNDTFVRNAREKYLQKLKNFQQYSESYSQYFVVKMVQSLETEQNPLFSSTGKTVSSLSTDLDFRMLLKHGDTYITSPLIQQLNDGLLTSQNFIVKKNFLSLLSDFVKWADIESFVQVSYEDTIDHIAVRIGQVPGQNGLQQGENIFPEVKGQKQAKKKFYCQFLKCLQIWAKCIDKDLQNQEQPSKVDELYQIFKNRQHFKFPENLMAKRIQTDFLQCMQYNKQRNEKILKKLRLDETSVINNKKSMNSIKSMSKVASISISKLKPNTKKSLTDIKKYIEKCYQFLDTLFDDEQEVRNKMTELFLLRKNIDDDFENLEGEPDEDELLDALDDGDAIVQQVNLIEPFYQQYAKGTINFTEFSRKIQQQLEQDYQHSKSRSRSKKWSSRSRSLHDFENDQLSSKNDVQPVENFMTYQSNPRQTIKTSEQILNRVPIRIQPQQRKNERFESESESAEGSIKEHLKQQRFSKSRIGNESISQSQSQIHQLESEIQNESCENSQNHRRYNSKHRKSELLSKLKNSRKNSNSFISNENESYSKNQIKSNLSRNFQEYGKKSSLNPSKISEKKASYLENRSIASSIKARMNLKMKKSFHKDISNIQNNKKERRIQNSSSYQKISEYESSNQKIQGSRIKTIIQNHRSNRKSKLTQANNSRVTDRNLENNYELYRNPQERNPEKILPQTQNKIQLSTHRALERSNKKISNFVEKASQKSSCIESYNKNIKKENLQNNFCHSQVEEKSKQQRIKEKKNQQIFNAYFNKRKTQVLIKNKGSNLQQQRQNRSSSLRKSRASHIKALKNMSEVEVEHQKQIIDQQLEKKSRLSKNKKFNSEKLLKNNSRLNKNLENCEKKPKNVDPSEIQNYSQVKSDYFDDIIRQPQLKPLENSYYHISQIQQKIKNNKKPSFKDCFDVQKEVIQLGKNNLEWISGNEYELFRKERKRPQSRSNYEGETLLRKFRSQKKDSKELSLSNLSKLKSDTMKIKASLNEKKLSKLESSALNSDKSRDQDFASSNRSERQSSFNSYKLKKSGASKNSMSSISGREIETELYDRYFPKVLSSTIKKCFLRSKNLLQKNDDLEIGMMTKYQQMLKIKIYLTSFKQIDNLTYKINQSKNLTIKTHPDSIPHLTTNKQTRLSLVLQLKNPLFTIPKITFTYNSQNTTKQKQLLLPCHPHKWITYSPVNPVFFMNSFQSQNGQVLKTEQFPLNSKVTKVDRLTEHLPHLTLIKQQQGLKIFGVEAKYSNLTLLLKFISRDNSHMTIQGISRIRSESVEYLLASYRYMLSHN